MGFEVEASGRSKTHYVPGTLWLLTSLAAQTVKCLSTMCETCVWSLGREVPWRRKWQPTPVLLPRKSHGRRSLVSMGSQRVRHDWATSLSLWHQRVFLHVYVSLILKGGKWRSLNPLLRQYPSLSCRGYLLEMFTGDKDWLFTLFLLFLPFNRANRMLTVNSSTEAPLSLVSGRANRMVADCKCPAWSLSISYLIIRNSADSHMFLLRVL